MEQHYLKSSFREKLIEHLFIGALLKMSWCKGSCSLEVAKPEVDNHGYDVIVEEAGIIRHMQLKTSRFGGSTASQKIHTALSGKPSGCVVWIYFNETTQELGPFLFFGGVAGKPLPSLDGFKTAKHTKGNAEGVKNERPAIKVVPKGKFTKFNTLEQVYERLFERR